MPEYPKTLSDPTGAQVPDRVVNNAAEESAARAAGFTVVEPSVPAPNAPASQEPFIQHPVENPTGLNVVPGSTFNTAVYLKTQEQFKTVLDEIHSATTHELREDALSRANAMVIELEEQAVAAEHIPSAIRRQADLLRRELNIARYVSPKNIPAPQFTTSSAVIDPSNPAHPAFSLRNPGVTRSVAEPNIVVADPSKPLV